MSTPKRIQMSRRKGWRKPEGAIYVGRPSKWGNPFIHAQRFGDLDLSLALYHNAVTGLWRSDLVTKTYPALLSIAYGDHCEFRRRMGEHPLEAAHRELRGHDLACWCAPDQPCHADVLLEVANA